ncbi:MAG: radical SAM family heme chaperone HemW [Thermodesulfovibrionales bacterium]|nr:radical SAM family heme chaperone HemW [Thermodesulfovibrionales bacterium]
MAGCLYIHIPFCIKKCVYCDFYSIPFNLEITHKYVEALCAEIEFKRHIACDLKTIYIGGGTPTLLSEPDILKVINTIKENYSVLPSAEITIEANPRTINEKKADMLLKSGINRLSIGAQSFIDRELTVLGRSHNANDALKALRGARKAGFNNISIDLIYAIPGQSLDDWIYSLKTAVKLSPEHISAYELTPEKNTPLYRDIQEGRIIMPDEELISEMYYKCIDTLTENGYIHYEISNFAKPNYTCLHNINYWERGEYLGIGAGAHSFVNDKRTGNVRDAVHYIESISKGKIPVSEEIEVRGDEALKENIFLGLRKTEGLDISRLPKIKDMLKTKAVKELLLHGLLEIKDNYVRLTRKGLLLSNEVIVRVLSEIESSHPS